MSDKPKKELKTTEVKCRVRSDHELWPILQAAGYRRNAHTLLALAVHGAHIRDLINSGWRLVPALPAGDIADPGAGALPELKLADITPVQPVPPGRDSLVAMDFATRFLQLSGRPD